MNALLVGMSHSPLIGLNDPSEDVLDEVRQAQQAAISAVTDFAPDLVVLFGPDHYNGFFYRLMPPFCLAREANAVGDFGSAAGPVSVDAEAADRIGAGVLERGIDLALSARMTVDHGMAQPLEILFGGLDAVPVVPVFINSVATPLGPMERVRLMGAAAGAAAAGLDRRVLFVASGGLSHDPPAPVLAGAPPRVADALIEGIAPTPEQRKRGEDRVVQSGRDYAAGTSPRIPLNADWDNRVLDLCAAGDLSAFDSWTQQQIAAEGGNSGHEIRAWVAAFAALQAYAGGYRLDHRYYRSIPEWVAGYAVATAAPA